jgi:hypothetical protein
MANNPNPEPTKTTSEADVDYSLWKIALIVSLGVFSAIGSGYFIAKNNLLLSAISIIFLFIFFCLQAFLIKGFGKISFAVLLQSIALVSASGLVKVGEIPTLVFLAAGALFFIFVLLGERAGRRYAENCLKLDFLKTTYVVLPKVIIGMIVFISVIYGATFNPAKALSPAAFSSMFRPLNPILNSYSPGFSFEMKTKDFLKKIAEDLLRKQLKPGEFEKIPDRTRVEAIDKISADFEKQLETSLGPIDPGKTIGENLYVFIDQKISRLLSSFPPARVSLVAGVIMFVLLKSVSFLFIWPTAFFGFLLYELLIIVNFARVSLEARSREIVLLN